MFDVVVILKENKQNAEANLMLQNGTLKITKPVQTICNSIADSNGAGPTCTVRTRNAPR